MGGIVAGLDWAKFKWDNSTVKQVTEILLEKYRQKSDESDEDEIRAFYTPYQFTLPILQALYFQLGGHGVTVQPEIIRKGELRASNPESRASARATLLRAIAYLSWEAESRVFLVRRVFPTYFDFLSVSHIPEGWGVSSIMLEKLQEEFDNKDTPEVENGSFFISVNVEDKESLPYMLPYLAEQKRLQYKHVLVLPVFHSSPPRSDRDMLGAYLFFIGNCEKVGLPRKDTAEDHKFCLFLGDLCKATAELVNAHNKKLSRSLLLQDEWRTVRRAHRDKARVAEVILRCDGHPHNGTCDKLEEAAREFLRELTVPYYYAIRDSAAEEKEKNNAAVFLVAARHDASAKDFKKRLLRIVTDKFSEREIICQVSIKASEPAAQGAFHLKTDRKWY
jgi:hypothetical protein